jgi:hypothetical protein
MRVPRGWASDLGALRYLVVAPPPLTEAPTELNGRPIDLTSLNQQAARVSGDRLQCDHRTLQCRE